MKTLAEILEEYQSLKIAELFDYERFNQYAIVHHSTRIEGSTLTEQETNLLLSENLTPKGKPLNHTLMVKNHYNALLFILKEDIKNQQLSIPLLKEINAKVLENTGSIYHTALGQVESAKGDFRLGNVSAGSSFFPNYNKVHSLTEQLCKQINLALKKELSLTEQLHLSFDAHFDLVSIHPWYDGNGRTSRLLMNFLQHKFNLPLAHVFVEDKQEYYEALVETRKQENLTIFRDFMKEQYIKFLLQEISKYNEMKNSSKRGKGFSFVF